MNYYISDTHFFHNNILKLCNRPFNSSDEMDACIINNWNSVVKNNDDVYILGDFSFKNKEKTIEVLKKLSGKKHLIIGNHDRDIIKDERLRKYFVSIDYYLEIKDNGRKVILFHYPILEWNGFFRDSIHLYGHIHNSDNRTNSIMKDIPNAYNVGVDVLGFTPRTLDEIISYSKK